MPKVRVYLKNQPFAIKGMVEKLNGSNNSVEITKTEYPPQTTVLYTTEDNVKKFIPYLYQQVSVDYREGVFTFNSIDQ